MRRRKLYVIAGAVMVIAAVAMTTIYMSQQKGKQLAKAEDTEGEQITTQEAVANAEDDSSEQTADVGNILEPRVKSIDEIKAELADTEGMAAQDSSEVAQIEGEEKTTESAKTDVADADEEAGNEDEAVATAGSAGTAHFLENSNLNWPLQGDVILNYSMDKTVYFATLDQYKYNPAVIISGNVNDRVNHVADGTVTDISTNENTGCTVTVDLGDGYEAIYGQLKSVMCKVGDQVTGGSAVGYISEPTKYYSVEGPNLYFALEKDDAPVDPVGFFQ